MTRAHEAFASAAMIGALAGFAAPSKAAELTITAQAVAAHGEFLTQAPAAPNQGVLCLVDSGVDVNPDTESILVGRESVFGGTPNDVTAYHHGTYVAMVAGAVANGWGMAGAWPGLRLYSVRAIPEGSDHLSGDAYRDGILACRQAKRSLGLDVKVIEFALGGPLQGRSEAELADIAEAIARARSDEINVVSAAGNDGGPVNAPAALANVVAVAATDRAGALCAFSSRGPGVDLAALGCDMDVAQVPDGAAGIGQSTSLASAYVAGVLVALRSFRPDLTAAQAENTLIGTTAAGGVLDVSAAFRAAGLAGMVDSYTPPASTPAAQAVPVPCDPRARVCVSPQLIKATRHGRKITLRLAAAPKGTRFLLRVDGRKRYQGRARRIVFHARRFKTISVRYTAKGLAPSAPLTLRPAQLRS